MESGPGKVHDLGLLHFERYMDQEMIKPFRLRCRTDSPLKAQYLMEEDTKTSAGASGVVFGERGLYCDD